MHKIHPEISSQSFLCRLMRAGFTLVEMLLVVCLFSVVSVAIYHSLASGVKIWMYAHQSFPEEDVMIALEKMTQDGRQAFIFSLLPFQGSSHAFEMPTRVITAVDADKRQVAAGSYILQMGKVRYTFDQGKKQLLRQQAGYGQALKGLWQPTVVLAKNIERVSFSYIYHDPPRVIEFSEGRDYLPAMIRVDIEYAAGKMVRRMVRLIAIPLGE